MLKQLFRVFLLLKFFSGCGSRSGNGIYVDQRHHFKIIYPREWRQHTLFNALGEGSVIFSSRDNSLARLVIRVAPAAEKTTLESKLIIESLVDSSTIQLVSLEENSLELPAGNFLQRIQTFQDRSAPHGISAWERNLVITRHDDWDYTFIFTYPANTSRNNRERFGSILNSLYFFPPEAQRFVE